MFYIEFEDNHVIDSREALCGNVFHKWETLGNELFMEILFDVRHTEEEKKS